MGAGNPLVRSYDDNRISVQTFFADFSYHGDVDDYIKEYEKECEGSINKETAYQMIGDDAYESFQTIFENTELDIHGFDGERIHELSGAFRGDGIVFATGENIYVIVPSGSEHYHIGFGFVPRRSWDSFWEDLHDLHAHKRKWYAIRDLDFDARINELTDNEFEKYIKVCNKEIKKVAATIADNFGDEYFEKSFTYRTGPWTSSRVTKTEFIRLAVI